jgi:hypothetical protein
MLSACLASARASAFTARPALRRAVAVWRRAVLRRRVAVPRFAEALRAARAAAVLGARPLLLGLVVGRRLLVVLRRRFAALRAPDALRRDFPAVEGVVAILGVASSGILP